MLSSYAYIYMYIKTIPIYNELSDTNNVTVNFFLVQTRITPGSEISNI